MKTLNEYIYEQLIDEGFFDFLSSVVTGIFAGATDIAKSLISGIVTGTKNTMDFISEIFKHSTGAIHDMGKLGTDLWAELHKDNAEVKKARANSDAGEALAMSKIMGKLDGMNSDDERASYIQGDMASDISAISSKLGQNKKLGELSQDQQDCVQFYVTYIMDQQMQNGSLGSALKKMEKKNPAFKQAALKIRNSLGK